MAVEFTLAIVEPYLKKISFLSGRRTLGGRPRHEIIRSVLFPLLSSISACRPLSLIRLTTSPYPDW
jgi:hypothetical protein